MKRNSGRPRNVRIKHGGKRHNQSGRPNWNRKDRFENAPPIVEPDEDDDVMLPCAGPCVLCGGR